MTAAPEPTRPAPLLGQARLLNALNFPDDQGIAEITFASYGRYGLRTPKGPGGDLINDGLFDFRTMRELYIAGLIEYPNGPSEHQIRITDLGRAFAAAAAPRGGRG